MNETDSRLTLIFNRLKVEKFGTAEHELLRRPYPEHCLAPVWNDSINTCAGIARVERGLIDLHPDYLLPVSRQRNLVEVILHEMLHVYCYHAHNYQFYDASTKGHGGPWKIIADLWRLTQYHNLAPVPKSGYKIPCTPISRNSIRFDPVDPYRKRRRLP